MYIYINIRMYIIQGIGNPVIIAGGSGGGESQVYIYSNKHVLCVLFHWYYTIGSVYYDYYIIGVGGDGGGVSQVDICMNIYTTLVLCIIIVMHIYTSR